MEKSFSRKELLSLSKRHRYPAASIEKTLRLLYLLDEIMQHDFLRDNIVLKGGTAINLAVFENLPRLSVDLDFDLARNTRKEEMLVIRELARRKIEEIASSQGYSLSPSRPSYALLQIRLTYKNSTGNNDVIKLDINCLSRCHIFEPTAALIKNPFENNHAIGANILNEYELFAGKIKALLETYTERCF